jgi:hypothetical protein
MVDRVLAVKPRSVSDKFAKLLVRMTMHSRTERCIGGLADSRRAARSNYSAAWHIEYTLIDQNARIETHARGMGLV